MAKYECRICGYEFDEQQAGETFDNVYSCPICDADKECFKLIEEDEPVKSEEPVNQEEDDFVFEEAEDASEKSVESETESNEESSSAEASSEANDTEASSDLQSDSVLEKSDNEPSSFADFLKSKEKSEEISSRSGYEAKDFIDEILDADKAEEREEFSFESAEEAAEEKVEETAEEKTEENEAASFFEDAEEKIEEAAEEKTEENIFENSSDNAETTAETVAEDNASETPAEEKTSEAGEYVIEKRQEFWKKEDEVLDKAPDEKGTFVFSRTGSVERVIGEEEKEAPVEEARDDADNKSDVIETIYASGTPVKSEEELKAEEEARAKETPEFVPLWGDGMGAIKKVIGADTNEKKEEPEESKADESEEFVFEEGEKEELTPDEEGVVYLNFDEEPKTEESVEEAKEDNLAEETAEEAEEVAAEETTEAAEEADDFFFEESFEESTPAEASKEKAEEPEVESEEVEPIVFEETEEEANETEEASGEEAVAEEETTETAEETVAEETVETVEENVAEEATEETAAEETTEAAEETVTEEEAVEETVAENEETAEAIFEEAAEETVEETAETAEVEEAAREVTENTEEAVEETAENTEEAVEETAENTEEAANEAEEVASENEATEDDIFFEGDESEIEDARDYICLDATEENPDGKPVAYSMLKRDTKYTVLYDTAAEKIFGDYPLESANISNGLENIILLPAQCNPLPLKRNAQVETKTVIGALTSCPVEVLQPFCFSKLFLWGEHIPNNSKPEKYANQALVLVKGEEGHIPNLSSKEELREEVAIAKARFNGTPVGIDLVAGRIEADLEACVYAKVDFVILNDVSSRILPYALRRARNYLNRVNSKLEILVCVEALKDAQELAKILVLGANFVLVERGFDLDMANNMTEALKEICRSTGHNNVHDLNLEDICTIDTDLAMYTDINHV